MTKIEVVYNGPVVNRADAETHGLTRYFTGKPCKWGHIDQRYVSMRACVKCRVETSKAWRAANEKKKSEVQRVWNENNKENKKLYYKKYKEENPDVFVRASMVRRKRVTMSDGEYSLSDVSNILERQRHKCAEPNCKADLCKGYHVDHIMPLFLGGSNWPSNLQCLCPTCNLRKGKTHPVDWAAKNGRLV